MTWKELLCAFMGLALCWAGAEKLLRADSPMTKAARITFGLLAMTLWLTGLRALCLQQALPDAPANPLFEETGRTDTDVQAAYASHAAWMAVQALHDAACDGQVEVAFEQEQGMQVTVHGITSEAERVRNTVAKALEISVEAVQVE